MTIEECKAIIANRISIAESSDSVNKTELIPALHKCLEIIDAYEAGQQALDTDDMLIVRDGKIRAGGYCALYHHWLNNYADIYPFDEWISRTNIKILN